LGTLSTQSSTVTRAMNRLHFHNKMSGVVTPLGRSAAKVKEKQHMLASMTDAGA
jgi:hypothetical protein